jgi:predicted O-methyltransferase YrrM
MATLRGFPAWYVRAHTAFSVHSPLLYSLCRDVLDDDRWYYAFDALEQWRNRLIATRGKIRMDGLAGALPATDGSMRTLADELRRSASPPWKGRFLFRLALWWRPEHIIEFGTNLGIGTAYLAAARPATPLHTLEQSGPALGVARELWTGLGLTNIHAIQGSFVQGLRQLPDQWPERGLYYIDGDHRPESVWMLLEHIRQHAKPPFLVVVDDIRWSEDMYSGWQAWPAQFPQGAWIDHYQGGLWIADPAFLEPVQMALIPRRFKPLRFGWI